MHRLSDLLSNKITSITTGCAPHQSESKRTTRLAGPIKKWMSDLYKTSSALSVRRGHNKEVSMKFGYTIVYVADVSRSIDFYERAFGFSKRFLADSLDYGELETGGTTLSFAAESMAEKNGFSIHPNRATTLAAGIELAFVTDDVESAFARAVKAGATPVKAAEQKPWGQVVAYVRDLDGVLVELCTPIG
jgi:lactoylglutathione lyase